MPVRDHAHDIPTSLAILPCPAQGATPDDRDAMHTDYGCYGPSDEQVCSERELVLAGHAALMRPSTRHSSRSCSLKFIALQSLMAEGMRVSVRLLAAARAFVQDWFASLSLAAAWRLCACS